MYIIKTEPLTIQLDQHQILIFEEGINYSVNVFTNCNNKKIYIENIDVKNVISTIY
jgi:hypothetical protein